MKRLALSVVLFAAAASLRAETFQIDPQHSKVMFRIRHLVGKVSGRFNKFEGTFDYEKGNPKAWKASAKIDAASIDTAIDKRDTHLRTADFLDVEKCPKIEFTSTKAASVKGDKAKLLGDLTLHCVTKPVALDLEIGGVIKDPWGNTRAGATATGTVKRKDFGIVWNKTLDAGGLMLGDDVEISLEIEGTPPEKKG